MFKDAINKEIEKVVQAGTVFSVERPENSEHGDYSSNVALVLAKKEGKNAKETAEELKNKLLSIPSAKWVKRIEIAGAGFLNFFIARDAILENLETVLKEKENFGKGNVLSGKKIIIEYTDPNILKEFHVGHFMSNTIGESLARIIEFNGAEVKRASYQSDVGIHMVYAITNFLQQIENAGGFDNWANGLSKEEIGRKIFLAMDYAGGFKMAQENKKFREDAKVINKKIYERDKSVIKIYDKAREAWLEYFEGVYGIIGMEKLSNGKYFDFYFFESETWKAGKAIVEKHLGDIFEKSDGAIVFKGEKLGLHTRVFINSEGLPTYEAKELGLAAIKYEKYPFDLSFVVTGNEVKDYFRVVLAAEKQIYPALAEKTKHIPHGMLRLPSGKMSSRTGEVITAEALYEEVKSQLKKRVYENEKILEKEKDEILNVITLGAIKYSILRHSIGSDIVFNFETSLAFEGDSGPYIQYVCARTNSVLEKASAENILPSFANYPKEFSPLEKLLLYFPDEVAASYENLNPNIISRYLLQLAGEFNAFYEKQKIIGVPESAYYVALTKCVQIVIKNGLNLLGISSPQKM